MRRVTRFKRSTAPSKAWMPNARPQCCCQAPQPRSGAPKVQGLIAGRWPQHNRPCRRSLPADAPTANNISTGANGSVALHLQSQISTSLTDVTLRGAGARHRSKVGALPARLSGARHLLAAPDTGAGGNGLVADERGRLTATTGLLYRPL